MFLALLITVFIAIAVILFFKMNELNAFQQEVNYQIERNGGLTSVIADRDGNLLPLPYNGMKNYEDIDINTVPTGYTRQGAFVELNESAKKTYGGCLARYSDSEECLFAEDRGKVKSSGFFVREIEKNEDGQYGARTFSLIPNVSRISRSTKEQARYGTSVEYVIAREIKTVMFGETSLLQPTLVGESSSRVRGVMGN